MGTEAYKVRLTNHVLVFVAANGLTRLTVIGAALLGAGAEPVGPLAFLFPRDGVDVPGTLLNVVPELEADECLYVVELAGGQARTTLVVEQRTTGGIQVGAAKTVPPRPLR